jgi:membrane protein YdbS with pleckstrin-like domain
MLYSRCILYIFSAVVAVVAAVAAVALRRWRSTVESDAVEVEADDTTETEPLCTAV